MSEQPTHASGHAMTNTHLLVHAFDYYEPPTLEEAITLLAEHGDRAQLMAGGTNLLVWMKMEQMAPEAIINLIRLPGLTGLTAPAPFVPGGTTEESLGIGALTRVWDLRNSAVLQADYTALAEACASFGSTQIQLMGTIGGNICNGSPASDTVPALVALDADLVVVGPGGERIVSVEEFLVGPGKVALEDGDVLTGVLLPTDVRGEAEGRIGSAFIKIARVRADLAKASAAAMIVRDGDIITDCRLAFGSVGPTVMRCHRAERMLIGETFSHELALAVGEEASQAVAPIDDVRATAWYRREVAKALTHDVVKAAWERASSSTSRLVSEATSKWAEAQASSDRGFRSTHCVARNTHHAVDLTINGVRHRLSVTSNELLLNVLRERLDLTGTKYSCGIGECGACTVHLDGVPTLACLTLAIAADGREVTTVEGLRGHDGTLDPVQEAFIEHAAFQCGYCTPGMLMMTKRLLKEMPAPGEAEIRDYLKGNRCRCTGFAAITRAVQSCGAPR